MALSRDALLAEIRRALQTADPDRADALLQELEYATGRDTRPVVSPVEFAGANPRDPYALIQRILAAVNRVEERLPWGRRVHWHARVTAIADTTVELLGVESEPVTKQARALALAAQFGAAFEPDLTLLREGPPGTDPSAGFFDSLRKLADGDLMLLHEVHGHVMGIFVPAAATAALPPAPARFSIVPRITPALQACFPDRAQAMLDRVWEIMIVPPPRARAIRRDGNTPGRSARELALQLVELLNAVENEQPEDLRCAWSAGPTAGGGIEMRAALV